MVYAGKQDVGPSVSYLSYAHLHAVSRSAIALPDMLKELDAQGMTLVSIHDRPAKTTLGQYVYVVECSGGGQDACEEIAEKCKDFTIRYLGSYPVLEIKNAQPLPANEETQDESE